MSNERRWLKIQSQQAVENLLKTTRDFHDAVITSAHWEGAEFVNKSGELELLGFGVLYLKVSSQFQDVTALELKFNDVSAFRYDYALDLDPRIQFTANGVVSRFQSWEVCSQGLEYRKISMED
jgi:hypothetical protein